jgi:adenylosuccinate synthase
MQQGKVNIMLDQAWGSSGKAKMACHLADLHGVTHASASCYPNSGHTAVYGGGKRKYVFKVLPSAVSLNLEGEPDTPRIPAFLSPGTGFRLEQLFKEFVFSGNPRIIIHDRASIVTDDHRLRECGSGDDSTKHIASTMQGSGAALSDKVMRKPGVLLARDLEHRTLAQAAAGLDIPGLDIGAFLQNVSIVGAMEFRQQVQGHLAGGATWLHEGSQGYALSIDHGSHYPHCTSRNCTSMKALDDLGIPPQMVGDVYLNLRTFPIRVGNVVEDGVEVGNSGGFYPDCEEVSWEKIAEGAGMDESEVAALAERERTTVTKRIRRACTFSWLGLRDACITNGVTKICVNFIQYLGMENASAKRRADLNAQASAFVDRIESETGLPVVAIGTGADHDAVIQ